MKKEENQNEKNHHTLRGVFRLVFCLIMMAGTATFFVILWYRIVISPYRPYDILNIMRFSIMLLMYMIFEKSYNIIMGYEKNGKPLRFTLFVDLFHKFFGGKSKNAEKQVGEKYYRNGKTSHPTQDKKNKKV